VHRRLVEICTTTISKDKDTAAPAKKPKQRQPAATGYELFTEKRRRVEEYDEDARVNRELIKDTPKTALEELFRFQKNESFMGSRRYESLLKLLYLHEIGIITRFEYEAMVS
jgi:hypothetical protein